MVLRVLWAILAAGGFAGNASLRRADVCAIVDAVATYRWCWDGGCHETLSEKDCVQDLARKNGRIRVEVEFLSPDGARKPLLEAGTRCGQKYMVSQRLPDVGETRLWIGLTPRQEGGFDFEALLESVWRSGGKTTGGGGVGCGAGGSGTVARTKAGWKVAPAPPK